MILENSPFWRFILCIFIAAELLNFGYAGFRLLTTLPYRKTFFLDPLIVCPYIEKSWKNDLNKADASIQLESIMKSFGAREHMKWMNPSHTISYYFRVDPNVSLESAKIKTINSFKSRGISSTVSWLDPKFYAVNHKVTQYTNPQVSISQGYIRISFELGNRSVQSQQEIEKFNRPPKHVLQAAKDANIKFIKYEHRILENYVYLYSIQNWWQFLIRFSNDVEIRIMLSNAVNADQRTTMDRLFCTRRNFFSALYNGN